MSSCKRIKEADWGEVEDEKYKRYQKNRGWKHGTYL